MQKQNVIFLHIPKTGGLTLHDILYRQYPKNRIHSCWNINDLGRIDELDAEAKKNLQVIKGHIRLEIAKKVPQKMLFFTLLREPIARTISQYYYIRRFKEHAFHKEMMQNDYSLQQMLEGGYVSNFDNCQVRFLADAHDVPYGAIDETHYRKAISNLNSLMASFGLVEFYDESILVFAEKFGWSTPYYAARNAARIKDKKGEHPKELLQKYNHYDLMLYAYAKDKFLAGIAARGIAFEIEVKNFRKKNRWFANLARIRRMLFGN